MSKLAYACLFILLLVACSKKSDYLINDGVSIPVTDLTNYDYLKANQFHQFDTLLLIIDHYKLKDSINNSGTFFAFTDYSISRIIPSMPSGEKISLDSFYEAYISSKFITQQCLYQKLSLSDATEAGATYTSWAGITVGVSKIAASPSSYDGYTVYNLYYSYINGLLDTSPPAAGDPTDARAICQTSGILTSSGQNVLNVLSNAISPPRR